MKFERTPRPETNDFLLWYFLSYPHVKQSFFNHNSAFENVNIWLHMNMYDSRGCWKVKVSLTRKLNIHWFIHVFIHWIQTRQSVVKIYIKVQRTYRVKLFIEYIKFTTLLHWIYIRGLHLPAWINLFVFFHFSLKCADFCNGLQNWFSKQILAKRQIIYIVFMPKRVTKIHFNTCIARKKDNEVVLEWFLSNKFKNLKQ